jgi:hypothetical protein
MLLTTRYGWRTSPAIFQYIYSVVVPFGALFYTDKRLVLSFSFGLCTFIFQSAIVDIILLQMIKIHRIGTTKIKRQHEKVSCQFYPASGFGLIIPYLKNIRNSKVSFGGFGTVDDLVFFKWILWYSYDT